MRKVLIPLGVLAGLAGLAGCAPLEPEEEAARGGPAPLAALEDQPQVSLMAHLLHEYFARVPANRPTICAAVHDGREEVAFDPAEERALMEAFPALAPLSRCTLAADGRWLDAESEEPALVFVIHGFTCTATGRCAGWGGYRSGAAASLSRYHRMEWTSDGWSVASDPRMIAR